MARRGDGIYLRGLTWRLDFIHEGKRPIETFDLNEEGILHSTAKIELRLTWGLFQNPDGDKPGLRLFKEGKRRAELAVDPDPYLTLSDKDGKVIWKAP